MSDLTVLIVSKANYWMTITLMMVGLYAMIAKQNLVKKIIGMNILQTAVILFFISIGAKRDATIPIVMHEAGTHGHAVQAVDYINPLPHVLMLTAIVVAVATLSGISSLSRVLPALAGDGLEPPLWLADYHWAKPAIMIMALWAAIGSNNMILYLAGLTNIPSELYEAASMDGASGRQRFWFVTWPQLAPVTFFIFIMSIIQGLQGGFEMARTMT